MNTEFNLVDSSLFNHPRFGKLQVLVDDQGEPWFIGKEVCNVLGYTNPYVEIPYHVDSRDYKVLTFKAYKNSLEASILWKGNDYSDKTLINESGVYSLILGSKLPSAREFKHWVTSEVLPSIRKYGHYDIHQPKRIDEYDLFGQVLKVLNANMQMLKALNDKKKLAQSEIAELTPKAEYTDKVLSVPDCITTTVIAKDLGMAAKGLNQILHDKKIEFCQAGTWHLYSDLQDKGLADMRTYTFGDDDSHCRESLVWTQKGRSFIINIVQNGMSPIQALRVSEDLIRPTPTLP